MRPLYTAKQSQAIDQMLIEQTPVSGYELMQRAGRACFNHLIKRWPQVRDIIVYTGVGNNGGDGYVLALLLHRAKRNVKVCQLGNAETLKGHALKARTAYLEAGAETLIPDQITTAELFIDAIFGSGLNRDLSAQARNCIDNINNCSTPVLCIDIPSGLDADSGTARPIAVNADITVSFITRKRGMYTADGRDYCGQLFFENLQTSNDIIQQVEPECWLLDHPEASNWLLPRRNNTHKKHFGHILIIGGNHGMAGAAGLAAKAALYSGAGLVSVLTQKQHIATLTAICPSLMVHDAMHRATLKKLMHHIDIIVIGPGLGRDEWALGLMSEALDNNKPLVVDADALHLLADDLSTSERWILTPHPGEAAHLLNTTTAEIQQDRFTAAKQIQARYGGVCVLKGSGTVVASADHLTLCEGGNAGMASAGMGDVLSGVIAAMLGQGLSMEKAALLGTCSHARAGDLAAANMPRGLNAEIVIDYLRNTLNDA